MASLGVPARFSEALFEADLLRMSDRGREALRAARVRIEREGVAADKRRPCHANHPSGTDLPGCVKIYVPDMAGRWRWPTTACMAPGLLDRAEEDVTEASFRRWRVLTRATM